MFPCVFAGDVGRESGVHVYQESNGGRGDVSHESAECREMMGKRLVRSASTSSVAMPGMEY